MANNPYIRPSISVPGSNGYASWADLANATGYENDMANRRRTYLGDQARIKARDAGVIAQKKMILSRKGYTPDEAEALALNPNFWHPDFQILGISRPTPVPGFRYSGTVTPDQRRRKAIDERIDEENYILDRRTASEIERQKNINAQLGDENAGRARGSYVKPTSATGKTAKAAKADDGLFDAINQESQYAGKKAPLKPGMAVDPVKGRTYLGKTVAEQLTQKNALLYTAKSALERAQKDAQEVDALRIAAEGSGDIEYKPKLKRYVALDTGSSSAASLAERVNAGIDANETRFADAQDRVAAAEAEVKNLTKRVSGYGLNVAGDDVLDPQTGLKHSYIAPVQGPASPAMMIDASEKRFARLPMGTRNEINERLSAMDGTVVTPPGWHAPMLENTQAFDRTADASDPTGYRARYIANPRRNLLAARAAEKRLVDDTAAKAVMETYGPEEGARILSKRPINRGLSNNDSYIVQQNHAAELDAEAQRLIEEEPDRYNSHEEAVREAARRVQSGERRRVYGVSPRQTYVTPQLTEFPGLVDAVPDAPETFTDRESTLGEIEALGETGYPMRSRRSYEPSFNGRPVSSAVMRRRAWATNPIDAEEQDFTPDIPDYRPTYIRRPVNPYPY